MAAMKIGVIDADLLDNGTRHPNLALMKLRNTLTCVLMKKTNMEMCSAMGGSMQIKRTRRD